MDLYGAIYAHNADPITKRIDLHKAYFSGKEVQGDENVFGTQISTPYLLLNRLRICQRTMMQTMRAMIVQTIVAMQTTIQYERFCDAMQMMMQRTVQAMRRMPDTTMRTIDL